MNFHSIISVKNKKKIIKKLIKKKLNKFKISPKVNKISVSKTIKMINKKINWMENLSWIFPVEKNPASKEAVFLINWVFFLIKNGSRNKINKRRRKNQKENKITKIILKTFSLEKKYALYTLKEIVIYFWFWKSIVLF